MTAEDKNDEIYKTEAMLQFALMRGDEETAAELRAKLMKLNGLGDLNECKPIWNGEN